MLAAKANGSKPKPYIVFRRAVDEAIANAVMETSANGLMNNSLVADWLQSVVGKLSVTPQLLVWDSYCCHIGNATRDDLKDGYNITTKYIQPAYRLFKRSLQDAYGEWAAGDANKDHTAEGYLQDPACHLLVDWAVAPWDKLDKDTIRLFQSLRTVGEHQRERRRTRSLLQGGTTLCNREEGSGPAPAVGSGERWRGEAF